MMIPVLTALIFILSIICIFLYSKNFKQNRNLVECKANYDLLKKSHSQHLMHEEKLSITLENVVGVFDKIIPSIFEIKKVVLTTNLDVDLVSESIQTTNVDLVSHFTNIANKITDTMDKVKAVIEATRKKLIHNVVGNTDKPVGDSIFNQEEGVKIIRDRYETLLQEIIDELILTNSRKSQEILRLDGIYKNVQNIQALSNEVTEIANGIELISLNARIEAARAGNAGLSFAVVASEVGKMALKSEDTAQKIRKELKCTNNTINNSISAIKSSMEAETIFLNSKIAVIKNVFETVIDSFFQLNNTLILSMGSSSEIKKEVEETINLLQLEYISTYLSSNLRKNLSEVLENTATVTNQLTQKVNMMDTTSKTSILEHIKALEKLGNVVKGNFHSAQSMTNKKEDVTFF